MKRLLLLSALLVSGCAPYDGHRAYMRWDGDGKCYEYTEPYGPGRVEWRVVKDVYCPGMTTVFILHGTV